MILRILIRAKAGMLLCMCVCMHVLVRFGSLYDFECFDSSKSRYVDKHVCIYACMVWSHIGLSMIFHISIRVKAGVLCMCV